MRSTHTTTRRMGRFYQSQRRCERASILPVWSNKRLGYRNPNLPAPLLLLLMMIMMFNETTITTTRAFQVMTPTTKSQSSVRTGRDLPQNGLQDRISAIRRRQTTTQVHSSSGLGGGGGVVGSNSNSNFDDKTMNPEVQRLKEEAARMRLEAEKMDWELTMSKLKALEAKVQKLNKTKNKTNQKNEKDDDDANPQQQLREAIDALEDQIRLLQQKLVDKSGTSSGAGGNGSATTTISSSESNDNSSTRALLAVATAATKRGAVVTGAADTDGRLGVSSSGRDAVVAAAAAGTTAESNTAASSVLTLPSERKSAKSATAIMDENIDSDDDDDEILAGFDQADLDLYIPVALEIEAAMPDATADERLEAFRKSPSLKENFAKKMSKLLVEPMQDMQRLEDLKSQYLDSSSTKEKELLKRQIDALSSSLEKDGPFVYSDSVYRPTAALTESATQAKLEAVSALPPILQTLYKQRHNLDSDNKDHTLQLAVMLDHYEEQMQLLEQIKFVTPLSNEVRLEAVQALESLPVVLRDHVASVVGLDKNKYTIDKLVTELSKDDDDDDDDDDGMNIFNWNPLKQVAAAAATTPDLPEYDDIEFVDRSQYVDEFYPAVARMEGQHPSLETVNKFALSVVDNKKTFMVTSMAERVIGGYYIRGKNLIDEDNFGVKMMERLKARLQASQSLFGKEEQFEYFYIIDPSPVTVEELEQEFRYDPVFLVTGKNATKFYNYASPWTKTAVSTLGLFSMGVFALGVCGLEPALQERLEAASVLAASGGGTIDLSWLTEIVTQLVLSLIAIQLAHEAGHRFVAWRDKFDIGLPTLVPSIQLGCFGTITPITSPPPDMKSMFDFGISGPLFGMVASLAIFVQGLSMTAALDLDQHALLPVLPTYLLRSSALGGGLIELFLGNGSLMQGLSEGSVLPLHAFAIAGYVGVLMNALALLPLGNTDGGRIALAMFGRRGTYVVKAFTTVLLCAAGLLGYDNSGTLLNYAIFALTCQTELEAPARNEVDELDFGRGALGIVVAIFVCLALLPMQ